MRSVGDGAGLQWLGSTPATPPVATGRQGGRVEGRKADVAQGEGWMGDGEAGLFRAVDLATVVSVWQ